MTARDSVDAQKRSIPAEALRRAMIVRGWSLTDFAREAGIDKNTATAALDDSRPLRLETESKILAALNRVRGDQGRLAALKELAS